VLPVNRIWSAKDEDAWTELERLSKIFELDPVANKAAAGAAGKLKRFWNWLERTGNTTELLGKVAGYKYLKEAGLDSMELPMRTRERISTPNWKKGGSMKLITNNVFMFSTVNLRGIEAGFRAANEAPGPFILKSLFANMFNRVLLKLAAMGLLGYTASQRDYLTRMVKGIPKADKTNSTVVPLKIGADGKTWYLRVPEDYMGQFAGQLTTALLDGNLRGRGGAVDALRNLNPYGQESNFLSIPWMIGNYLLKGENSYDPFYQRNHLKDDELKAGGMDAAKALGMEAWNGSGLGVIHRFNRSEAQRDRDPLEQILDSLPGNMLGTLLRKSDAGLTDQYEEPVQQAEQDEARLRLRARDAAEKIYRAKGAAAELSPEETEGAGQKPDVLENALMHKELVGKGGEEGYLADALSRAKSEREKAYIQSGGRPKLAR